LAMFDRVIGVAMLAVFLLGLAGLRQAWRGNRYTKITNIVMLVWFLLFGVGELVRPALVRDWLWVAALVYMAVYLFGRYRSRSHSGS
jgi:hypothetical protein